MKLKEDQELAEKVVKRSDGLLRRVLPGEEGAVPEVFDVNRTPSTYFAALDDVEAMNDEVSRSPCLAT